MQNRPRIGYAVRDTSTRIHAPRRYLPIVIVPDFMGTRLSDGSKLAWNPMGAPFGDGPGVFTVDYKRLGMPAELEPDTSHKYAESARNDEVKGIKNFFNLVPDIYGDLAKQLAGLDTSPFEEHGIRPRVYVAGYDWRQDNARSALRLAKVVDEALRETREDRCIVIAHGMGGLVARYFCRVLGGESRVHQLFLLGSPTLGIPKAFLTLKHGMSSPLSPEMAQHIVHGEPVHAVAEGVATAAALVGFVAGAAAGDAGGAALELLNLPYLALSLGAGRMLPREETIYFVRQLTALYQLMPTSIYCEHNKNWLVFDPLATALPPTGHMVVFPTLLDAGVEIAAVIAQNLEPATAGAGDQLKADVMGALAPGRAERTNARATRNVTTLAELLEKIVHVFGNLEEDFEEHAGEIGELFTVAMEIVERAEQMFVDCGHSGKLYKDIYTGLLDRVAQRPMVAANLALAARFERALTIRYSAGESTSPLELVEHLLEPVIGEITLLGEVLFSGKLGQDGAFDEARGRRREQEERRESQAHARRPVAYMHPRTVNIFAEGHLCEFGGVILPTDIVSLDDSNVVENHLIPIPTGLPGDGAVPAASANPAEDHLQRPFFLHRHFHTGHDGLASSDEVITYIKGRLENTLGSFCGIEEEAE